MEYCLYTGIFIDSNLEVFPNNGLGATQYKSAIRVEKSERNGF